MFYLDKDNKTVVDSFGDKVGFVKSGKFCQVYREKNKKTELCDKQYINGLSPVQLEQVSELIQRAKVKR